MMLYVSPSLLAKRFWPSSCRVNRKHQDVLCSACQFAGWREAFQHGRSICPGKKKAGGIHLKGTRDPFHCFQNQGRLLFAFTFAFEICVVIPLSQNPKTGQEDVLRVPSLYTAYGKAGINSKSISNSLDDFFSSWWSVLSLAHIHNHLLKSHNILYELTYSSGTPYLPFCFYGLHAVK